MFMPPLDISRMAAARAAKSEMMTVALMVMWVTDYFFSDLKEQLLPDAPLPRFLYPLSHGHVGHKKAEAGHRTAQTLLRDHP